VPTREELLQIANQKAAEAAINKIAREAQANAENYYELAATGRYDDAADHLREAWRLDDEARKIAAAVQSQQPQQQYTQAEQDLMNHYPEQVRRNWNTAVAAHNNLIASKRKADPEADLWAYRNSAEYIGTIAHACGILDANFAESNETTSPDTALAACQSKYGPVTVEEYNQGVRVLAARKARGDYPMSQ
jgi:hypothetical protein